MIEILKGRGLDVATNHGVGVRIPPRPQAAKKGRAFTLGGRKIMIGITGPKLWNLGVGLLSK